MKINKEVIHKIMLLIILILFSYNIFSFMNSFHSLDLGHNGIVFQEKYKLPLVDYSTDYNYYSVEDIYIKGINGILQYYLEGLLLAFGLGVLINGK